jgi:hypothetical protein
MPNPIPGKESAVRSRGITVPWYKLGEDDPIFKDNMRALAQTQRRDMRRTERIEERKEAKAAAAGDTAPLGNNANKPSGGNNANRPNNQAEKAPTNTTKRAAREDRVVDLGGNAKAGGRLGATKAAKPTALGSRLGMTGNTATATVNPAANKSRAKVTVKKADNKSAKGVDKSATNTNRPAAGNNNRPAAGNNNRPAASGSRTRVTTRGGGANNKSAAGVDKTAVNNNTRGSGNNRPATGNNRDTNTGAPTKKAATKKTTAKKDEDTNKKKKGKTPNSTGLAKKLEKRHRRLLKRIRKMSDRSLPPEPPAPLSPYTYEGSKGSLPSAAMISTQKREGIQGTMTR